MVKYFLAFILFLFQIQYAKVISEESDSVSNNYLLFDYIESLSADDYDLYRDSIKNGLSDDYFSLRMTYAKTKSYSPYSTEIRETHQKIESAINDGKYDLALQLAETILNDNFPDTDSHLYCAYAYTQLNDSTKADYHLRIYNGLLESIYMSGDGLKPETAYIVISTKEEYSFLNWFRLKFLEQQLVYKDKYAFDLMKSEDVETGDEVELYFNITIALKQMEESFK